LLKIIIRLFGFDILPLILCQITYHEFIRYQIILLKRENIKKKLIQQGKLKRKLMRIMGRICLKVNESSSFHGGRREVEKNNNKK
jgi:hypothetical protein